MTRFQRDRETEGEQRATTLELFYDLVFVFAITQISHLLLHHLTWTGAGQSLLVLLVVWWAWNYTTWVTNELDPESTVVRLVLIAVMLASLMMAVAIPKAFGSDALLFVGAYVAIQVGRHIFLTFGSAESGSIERHRAGRILAWFVAAGTLWVAGAIADGETRTVLWLAALAIDYSGPLVVFWIPGMPRIDASAWNVETSHFAERFQLFIIIALGESIVITGTTTSQLDLGSARIAAFAIAFLSTAAMWWLYFTYMAQVAERRLELAEHRTTTARDGYTYLHVVMVAGIIVAAVGDELVIARPGAELGAAQLAAIVAGPAIYLLALALFRLRLARSMSWKRLAGALACAAVAPIGAVASSLLVSALLLGVLVAVIASEQAAATLRKARGEPSPLELLEGTVSS
jgi:low temperature requirement protein LtrA